MAERETLKDMVVSAKKRRDDSLEAGARPDFISAALNAANAAAAKADGEQGGHMQSKSNGATRLVVVMIATFAALAVFALGYWRS